jgi:hypothetical protein
MKELITGALTPNPRRFINHFDKASFDYSWSCTIFNTPIIMVYVIQVYSTQHRTVIDRNVVLCHIYYKLLHLIIQQILLRHISLPVTCLGMNIVFQTFKNK